MIKKLTVDEVVQRMLESERQWNEQWAFLQEVIRRYEERKKTR